MKAIIHTRYGSPDLLRLEETPLPEPKDDQVLVKIRATAVNDWDWCLVRGRPYLYRLLFGLRKPRVRVPGVEIAGTVEVCGAKVSRFRPGDRVYGDVSEAGCGGFAEYVSVREDALGPMPKGMPFEQAAALPHAGLLALQGLVELGQLRPGERVLINGAGGGVGTLGIHIAKQEGSEVTGVDSAPKLDTLRSIGFDHVLDYRRVDFTRTGQRYDVILDTKTDRSVFSYLRALNPGGRYVTVGGRLPRLLEILFLGPLLKRITGKRVRILALKPNKDLDTLNELYEAGLLTGVIDGPYPLTEIPWALRRFGEAEHVGKVVITVGAQARSGGR